jgi:hypothetical protein
MSDIRRRTLEESVTQLKMNKSLIEMLKGTTEIEVIARFREIWVDPLEVLVNELKQGSVNRMAQDKFSTGIE